MTRFPGDIYNINKCFWGQLDDEIDLQKLCDAMSDADGTSEVIEIPNLHPRGFIAMPSKSIVFMGLEAFAEFHRSFLSIMSRFN